MAAFVDSFVIECAAARSCSFKDEEDEEHGGNDDNDERAICALG